jgi:D-sedoheptulose 7-phosphate isomerase
MYRLKELFGDVASPSAYMRGYLALMAEVAKGMDAEAIATVGDIVDEAGKKGRTIYTIGNGGSAVVASHFVNDMGVNTLIDGQPGYRVFCLADNAASVTASANDAGFDEIFRCQLRAGLEPGDVLIAMSVSGNSENIVRAVEYANEIGAVTVGFCGFDGGRLAKTAQHVVQIESTKDEYGPVEDAFSIICHAVSGYLSMRRGRFLHH